MRPRALRQRALAALAVAFALVLGSAATPALAAAPAEVAVASASIAAEPAGAVSASTPSPEAQVATLINKQRAAAGLPALKVYSTVAATAERWAQHMVNEGCFHHSTSTWRTGRLSPSGWASSGENLAAGYTSAAAAVSAWMASSGHKANILGKSYRGMGVGFVKGGKYGYYWVVVFTIPKPAMPKGKSPALSGSSRLGGTVTAQSSGWPSGTTLKWQWLREGSVIAGATSSTYRVTSTDLGVRLQVKVSASNSHYYPTSILSRYTQYVAV